MNIDNLQLKIIEWANDKKLLTNDNAHKQLIKTYEELGEVSRALLKNDRPELIDGLGDVLVTLIIFAEQNDLDLFECLEVAWNEIKDRTGKTKDGIFIKDSA